MQFDVREFFFDLAKRIDVIFQSQFRMMSALQQQLITAVLDRFPDFLPVGVHIGDVRFWVAGDAVEITEFAIGDADVGGVDIAIDLPGYFAVWYLLFAQLIGDVDQVGEGCMVV
jgi:hypothetical protein